jgi:hypothetical protein
MLSKLYLIQTLKYNIQDFIRTFHELTVISMHNITSYICSLSTYLLIYLLQTIGLHELACEPMFHIKIRIIDLHPLIEPQNIHVIHVKSF